MKQVFLCLSLAFISLNISAAEVRVQKVKTLGSMKHKVIFQSTDLKKIRGSKLLKGKIVAQWGLYVFEVATGYYSCDKRDYCKLTDYDTVGTFEKCTVKSNKKVKCSNRIGGGSYQGPSDNEITYENPDVVYDEYNRDRGHYDQVDEFPARVSGEYGDIHF